MRHPRALVTALALGFGVVPTLGYDCGLPGLVAPADRTDITLDGVDMPFGISILDWASAHLTGHMAQILVSEALGINSVVTGVHPSSPGGLMAIIGCTTPDAAGSLAARGCGNTFSTSHAVMEAWSSATGPAFIAALTSVVGKAGLPVDLGAIGYEGVEGLFVPTGPRMAALENAGLALEFYRSYNTSWHSPNLYFQNYTAIDTTGLLPCRTTKFALPELLNIYLELTNDTDGVETVDGALMAKCHGGPDGYWWFSPACRSNPETCIPVIDSGDGWFVDVFMQRSGVFNMPLALSVATWGKYTATPPVTDMVFYWWAPDTAFVDLRPMQVAFPANNKVEWGRGVKTTDSKATECKKWIHPAIPDIASRAAELLQNFQLTMQQLEEMLIELKLNSSKTAAEVACDWLKGNYEIWRYWLPYETKCPNGWGLVNTAKDFVTDRSLATSCNWCPPGTFSQKISDSLGQTAICVPCGTGLFQPTPGQMGCLSCAPGEFAGSEGMSECDSCRPGTAVSLSGSSECLACSPGTFAASDASSECKNCTEGNVAPQWGSQACAPCGIGTYADRVGLANCTECGGGAPRWTTMRRILVKGEMQWVKTDAAESETACGCDVGARVDDTGECADCNMEGITCPGMGQVIILPGYYSPADLSVFRCGTPSKCKGGVPGNTCSDGREGISCTNCQVGLTAGDGGVCVPCGGGGRAPFAILITLCILACFAAYYLIDRGGSGQPSHTILLLGVSAGLLVGMAQQLSVVSKLDVEYMEPLHSFMLVVKFFTFDVESFIHLSCIGTLPSAAHFATKVCLIFASCLVVLICHVFFVCVRYKFQFRERNPTLIAVFGTLGMVFYISVTVTVLQPFQCNANPNGKWTTQVYEDVICWEPDIDHDHPIMLGIGCAALFFPITLVAKVFLVTRQLPNALKTGDAGFMRSYGFLFFRFRPHAHWYIMVIISRSLLIGIVPVIPVDIAQVYALQITLLACFAACIYVQPWRIGWLNAVDAFFNAVLILFLNITAFLVKSDDMEILGWVCVSMVLAALGVFVVVFVLALLRRFGKIAKPYRFFLCHCKAEAGAFARWMKLELVSLPQVQQEVFLDSDNLDSLDRLLGYVASDLQTLVVIASKTIFYRPWCVGEMTTAHGNDVESIVLQMPDFDPLMPETIEKYESVVPDLEALCVDNGLTLTAVRVALSVFSMKERIEVPTNVYGAGMTRLCKMLVEGTPKGNVEDAAQQAKTIPQVIIVRDRTVEANAIAFSLQRLMVRYTAFAEAGAPEVLCIQDDERVPWTAQKALLLCTQGCFNEFPYLNRILEMSDRGTHVLPVIGDDEFRVPRPETFLNIQASLLRPVGEDVQRTPEMLARVVAQIFKEIAVPFKAKMDRITTLDAAAMRASKRLLDPPYKRDGSQVGMASTSEAVTKNSETGFEELEDAELMVDETEMDGFILSTQASPRPFADQLSTWAEHDIGRSRV